MLTTLIQRGPNINNSKKKLTFLEGNTSLRVLPSIYLFSYINSKIIRVYEYYLWHVIYLYYYLVIFDILFSYLYFLDSIKRVMLFTYIIYLFPFFIFFGHYKESCSFLCNKKSPSFYCSAFSHFFFGHSKECSIFSHFFFFIF